MDYNMTLNHTEGMDHTKMHQSTTDAMEMTTYAFAGNRVFLVEEPLAISQPVGISLRNLADGMLGKVRSVKLRCDNNARGISLTSGLYWYFKKYIIK